jgi:integrase
MPKRREKGLCSELNRHGTRVWYYREGQGQRTRIHGVFGSPEFNAALKAARGGAAEPVGKTTLSHTDPNSFGWLVDQYLKSPAHLQKEVATQKARRNVLKAIVDAGCGSQPYRELTDSDIRALRDEKAATGKVAMANGAVAILRVMFNWAVEEAGLLRTNPCLGVKAIKYQGGTNHVWTDEETAKFEEAYPLGTRERLAYSLLLYTGQRSGDVVRMGRQHVKMEAGLPWLTIVAKKTAKHASSEAAQVPVIAALSEAIAASPTGDLTYLVDDDGRPMKVEAFGKWLRAACDKAGLPECTPHGLRHVGATRLVNGGADANALQCIYGWSLAMCERYTRKATRKASALKHIHLLNRAA